MLDSLRQLPFSIYALSAASGVVMTGFMMILPILPAYSDELGFNEFEIGLLVASFALGRVLFQFPVGILSDHIGRRWIISSMLLLFTVTISAFSMTTSFAMMLLLRMLEGVASSGLTVGAQSYLNDVTPPRLRGLANGVNSSAINLGVIAGPLLAGILSQRYSLQSPFLAGGVLGGLTFLLSLTLPAIENGERPHRPPLGPATVKRLLKPALSPPSLSLSLIQFMQMLALAVFLTAAPILTAQALGWDADRIALALAVGGACGAIASPFLGRLSDHVGHLWLLGAGLVFMAVQSFLVYLHPGAALTVMAFAIGGAAAPAFFNAFYSLVGDATDPRQRGAVTGFVGSFGEWGGIIGSGLLVPMVWRLADIGDSLALNTVILLLTVMVAIVLRNPLRQEIGRRESGGS